MAKVKDELVQEKRQNPLDLEEIYEVYKYKDNYTKYKSRRLQNYDDSDSEGDQLCEDHSNR